MTSPGPEERIKRGPQHRHETLKQKRSGGDSPYRRIRVCGVLAFAIASMAGVSELRRLFANHIEAKSNSEKAGEIRQSLERFISYSEIGRSAPTNELITVIQALQDQKNKLDGYTTESVCMLNALERLSEAERSIITGFTLLMRGSSEGGNNIYQASQLINIVSRSVEQEELLWQEIDSSVGTASKWVPLSMDWCTDASALADYKAKTHNNPRSRYSNLESSQASTIGIHMISIDMKKSLDRIR